VNGDAVGAGEDRCAPGHRVSPCLNVEGPVAVACRLTNAARNTEIRIKHPHTFRRTFQYRHRLCHRPYKARQRQHNHGNRRPPGFFLLPCTWPVLHRMKFGSSPPRSRTGSSRLPAAPDWGSLRTSISRSAEQ
jgi:hypothetical protein